MPRRKEIRSKVCVVAKVYVISIETWSRSMENGLKVCVVAKVHVISIETWSRRMENGLKVCVVTLVKGGRYNYEAMHVHHVIAKPGPRHVIAKPGRAVAIFLNG